MAITDSIASTIISQPPFVAISIRENDCSTCCGARSATGAAACAMSSAIPAAAESRPTACKTWNNIIITHVFIVYKISGVPNCTFHATKPQRYAKIFNTRDKKCSVSSRGSVDAERFDLFVEGVQDLHLGVQEVVGDVNLVVVRVDQASFGWAEVREDVVVEGFLLRQRVASGADPAVSYDLMLKGSPGIF